ncbi:hypothetical protein AYK26_07685 [Euryarchaeota archaeon SM23-78]|nr:MAG: hypothetical protein AYK26_07685 [Euryarchaeota archaeon SM23-78]
MEEQEQQESVLLLKFLAPGSANFAMEAYNVNSMQLLAAASYLELMAKDSILLEKRRVEAKEEEKNKIVLPNDGKLYSGM